MRNPKVANELKDNLLGLVLFHLEKEDVSEKQIKSIIVYIFTEVISELLETFKDIMLPLDNQLIYVDKIHQGIKRKLGYETISERKEA
jgi:hypothetical protein